MVREKDLPIFDAKGREIHIGDTVLQGMREGDPKGWTELIMVRSRIDDEILGEDPVTHERQEFGHNPKLTGVIHCPHEAKP
jgi:hypothetical protein